MVMSFCYCLTWVLDNVKDFPDRPPLMIPLESLPHFEQGISETSDYTLVKELNSVSWMPESMAFLKEMAVVVVGNDAGWSFCLVMSKLLNAT